MDVKDLHSVSGKARISGTAPPAILRAIGLVVIKWAWLERFVHSAVWHFLRGNKDKIDEPIRLRRLQVVTNKFNQIRSLTELLILLAREELAEPDLEKLILIADDINTSSEKRNDIVHGLWWSPLFSESTTTAMVERRRIKKGILKRREKPYTEKELNAFSDEIVGIQNRLYSFFRGIKVDGRTVDLLLIAIFDVPRP